jgi:SAM-dependent methyltransferase
MLGLTPFQWIVLILFALMCIHYVLLVSASGPAEGIKEGFEGSETGGKLYTWITDPSLIYDDTYSQIYDQLTMGANRQAAEVALCVKEWKKETEPHADPAGWKVLDVGCGTGIACQAFAKIGAGSVVGLDKSGAMLRKARENLEESKSLTDDQKAVIQWRQDDAYHVNAAALGEFTHATVFYFTIYYMRDKELFFRHLHGWTKPGGRLAVEVVNKYKFDPMLDSANPFVFSLQKYSEQRLKRSEVKFNKIDYVGDFDLEEDDKAEFKETLTFKETGVVRRQRHELWMPNLAALIADAERAHWKYIGFQDLLPIGFEYAYLLMFERDDSL